MVVAAGFTAEARPLRLLSLDITTMFEARGVQPLRASRSGSARVAQGLEYGRHCRLRLPRWTFLPSDDLCRRSYDCFSDMKLLQP